MTLKFSQFANGGPLISGDQVAGLRSGINTIFNANAVANALLKANNLSDVANSDTSRINLNAPKITSGSGTPQGAVAGEVGDLYVDTIALTDKFYVCIVAGTNLTAQWLLQINAIDGALLAENNLSDVADAKTSLSNIGGQPITISGSGNPNGVVDGIGSVSLYFDTSNFEVWKCDVTGNSSWERLVGQRDIQEPFVFYYSGIKGDDTNGTGSIAFPFASYPTAAAAAALVASAATPCVVYAMDNTTVLGDVTIYPFVYLRSGNANTGGLRSTGNFVLDASWDTTANPVFYATDISLISDIGMNFTFNVSQNAVMVFYNSQFTVATSIVVNGSGGANNEIFLNILNINISNPPAFDLKNIVAAFDLITASRIFMDNEFTSNQSLLICSNASTPGALGDITIQGDAPYPGTILFTQNCQLNSLTMDGVAIWLTDATSYTSNISFLGGASFGSILNLTSSDGINANINFSPVNYTLPTATAYPQTCVTNNLAGIDNQFAVAPTMLYADRNDGSPALVVGPASNSYLFFPNAVIGAGPAYDGPTSVYTIPKDGKYEIQYSIQLDCTGTALNSDFWADSSIQIDGTFVNSDYATSRRSDLIAGVAARTNNEGFRFAQLTAGQTISVFLTNNGTLDVSINHASLGIKFLGN